MKGENTVSIKLDSSYKAKIEQYCDFEKSLFKDQYNNAAMLVQEILDASHNQYVSNSRVKTEEPSCNIISFIGERGKGKTSAMRSFCGFLKDFHRLMDDKENVMCSSLNNYSKKINFTVLDCIDATFLESKDKIVDIILGRLWDTMGENHLQYNDKVEVVSREIKKHCSDIYKSLHTDESEEGMDIYDLSEVNRIVTLKAEFKELIDKYNHFMVEQNDSNYHTVRNCLVIPIDDIDMNVKYCYDMLEMLRKFFMVPNVVILLTINYHLLESACQNYYLNNIVSSKDVEEEIRKLQVDKALSLSREYLEKIIPTGRKIYMPDLYRKDGLLANNIMVLINKNRNGDEENISIQDYILFCIRRYFLISEDVLHRYHFLLPSTLRKLSNYVKEFEYLKKLVHEDNKNDFLLLEKYEYNSRWFYNDIVNRFVNQNVDIRQKKIIDIFLDYKATNSFDVLIKQLFFTIQNIDEESSDYTTWKKELISRARLKKKNAEKDMHFSYGETLSILCILEKDYFELSDTIYALKLLISLTITHLMFNYNLLGEEGGSQAELELFTLGDYWGDWDDWYVEAKMQEKMTLYAIIKDRIKEGAVIMETLSSNNEFNIPKIRRAIQDFIIVNFFSPRRMINL